MGRDAWWSVPAAVLVGIPMYSNAAGIIPVVEALLGKGAALGTVLAFMMSVIALSLPEMIILRKVLSVKLIAVFVGVVGDRHPRRRLPVQPAVRLRRMRAMKNVKVLGPGCKRCDAAVQMVKDAAAQGRRRGHGREGDRLRRDRRLRHRLDAGLVVDGKVVHAGGLPKAEDVARWIGA